MYVDGGDGSWGLESVGTETEGSESVVGSETFRRTVEEEGSPRRRICQGWSRTCTEKTMDRTNLERNRYPFGRTPEIVHNKLKKQ